MNLNASLLLTSLDTNITTSGYLRFVIQVLYWSNSTQLLFICRFNRLNCSSSSEELKQLHLLDAE